MTGSSSIDPAGNPNDQSPYVLRRTHRDDRNLAEVFDIATERHTVLGHPRAEDHQRVLFDEFEERVAHGSEGSVRETLNRADHQLDRSLYDAALHVVVDNQLQREQDVFVVAAVPNRCVEVVE